MGTVSRTVISLLGLARKDGTQQVENPTSQIQCTNNKILKFPNKNAA